MDRTIVPCVESLASLEPDAERDGARLELDVAETFAREGDYVHATLRRLGVWESDLEDAVHEVFIAVHRQRTRYDAGRALRPWLFGFAVRVAANYRRTMRRRREAPPSFVEPADDRPNAEAELASSARRGLLLRALDSLDAGRREVLVLHDLDGVAMPEVASALGLPLNTAYSRLRLAREDVTAAVRRLRARGPS